MAYESITPRVTLIFSVVHTVHICGALTTMHLAENGGELCGPFRLLIDSILQKRFQKDPAWRRAEDGDHQQMDVWHLIRHHSGSTRLLASAATCRLCRMIYDSLVELQDQGGRTEEYSIIVDRRNHSPHTMGFFIDCPNVNLRYCNIPYGFHEFFTAHDLNSPLTGKHPPAYHGNIDESGNINFDPGKEVFSKSNSPQCASLASKWLSECLRNHQKCRRDPNRPYRQD